MKQTPIRAAMAAVCVAALSACGDKDKMDDEVVVMPPAPPVAMPPPFVIATAALETLGASFAGLFRADANTEPRDPAEGDLPPISFTAEPAEITGV